jgi:hypothetical protein
VDLLFGGLIGVYVNIHSNISENRRSIDDVREELNKFMIVQKLGRQLKKRMMQQ